MRNFLQKQVLRFANWLNPIDNRQTPAPTSIIQREDSKMLRVEDNYVQMLLDDPEINSRISMVLEFDAYKMKQYIEPILHYVAQHTLQLPASEKFHHTYPGALYHHLMEVGVTAAKHAKSDKEMRINARYEDDALYGKVVPLAAFISGILHDIAKPATDYYVYPYDSYKNIIPTPDGCWKPLDEPLTQYLSRYNAVYYKAHINMVKDYRKHEKYSSQFVTPLLDLIPHYPHKTLLREIIMDREDPLKKLKHHVNKADTISCAKDRARAGQPVLALELGSYFINVFLDFDFTYRVLRDDNEHQNYYVISDEGLHIHYPAGVNNIVKHLTQRLASASYVDVTVPTCSAHWVQDLGKERLLVPDFSHVTSPDPKYPEAGKFINELTVVFDEDSHRIHQGLYVTIPRSIIAFQDLLDSQIVEVRNPAEQIKARPAQPVHVPVVNENQPSLDLGIPSPEDHVAEQDASTPSEDSSLPATKQTDDTPSSNKNDIEDPAAPTEQHDVIPHDEEEAYIAAQQASQPDDLVYGLPEDIAPVPAPSKKTNNTVTGKKRPQATAKKKQVSSAHSQPKTDKHNTPDTPTDKTGNQVDKTRPTTNIAIPKPVPQRTVTPATHDDLDKLMTNVAKFSVSKEECEAPADSDNEVSDYDLYAKHKVPHLHTLVNEHDVLRQTPLVMLWLVVVYHHLADKGIVPHGDFAIHHGSKALMAYETSLSKSALAQLLLQYCDADVDSSLAYGKQIDTYLAQKHIRKILFIQAKEKGMTRFKPAISKLLQQPLGSSQAREVNQ